MPLALAEAEEAPDDCPEESPRRLLWRWLRAFLLAFTILSARFAAAFVARCLRLRLLRFACFFDADERVESAAVVLALGVCRPVPLRRFASAASNVFCAACTLAVCRVLSDPVGRKAPRGAVVLGDVLHTVLHRPE